MNEEEQLRAEVFALGGDESDLELISEKKDQKVKVKEEEEEELSAKARKDLEAFIKNLGLDTKFKQEAEAEATTDEDEEEMEVDSSSDGDEDDDDEVEEEEDDVLQDSQVSSTTTNEKAVKTTTTTPQFHFVKEKPERRHCVAKMVEGKKWYQILEDAESDDNEIKKTSDYWVAKLEKFASSALQTECDNAEKSSKNNSSSHLGYVKTVLQSGSLADKISAYTVLLQESPVSNLKALDSLLSMVSLKSRRPCMMAMSALKDLFVQWLLPQDRKLKSFKEHSFDKLEELSSGNKDVRDKHLILWLFEARLKEAYAKYLTAVDEVAKDTIEKSKISAMTVFLELLMAGPEGEEGLLARIVNKLGDPAKKVASKAVYQLGVLLKEHSAMKEVVLKEVERLLYRSNVGRRAQYYGVCFLSQILLEPDESDLAGRLISIFFGFFRANVKRGDVDTKLMSALLAGVNRAFPYAGRDAREKLGDQIQVKHHL